jgi:hypothetical protein
VTNVVSNVTIVSVVGVMVAVVTDLMFTMVTDVPMGYLWYHVTKATKSYQCSL